MTSDKEDQTSETKSKTKKEPATVEPDDVEAIELGADVMIDQELKENEPYTDVETAELDEEVQTSNQGKKRLMSSFKTLEFLMWRGMAVMVSVRF